MKTNLNDGGVPNLRPISVLMVVDDDSAANVAGYTDEMAMAFRRSQEREFADAASAALDQIDESERPAFLPTIACWFPEALLLLAEGQSYDVYIIDIEAVTHPRNELAHSDYASKVASFTSVLRSMGHNPAESRILSGRDILNARPNSADTPGGFPIVAYFSSVKFTDRAALSPFVTHSARRDKQGLSSLLLHAVAFEKALRRGLLPAAVRERIVSMEAVPICIDLRGDADSSARLIVRPERNLGAIGNGEAVTVTPKEGFTRSLKRLSERAPRLRHLLRMAPEQALLKSPGSLSNLMHYELNEFPDATEKGIASWLNRLTTSHRAPLARGATQPAYSWRGDSRVLTTPQKAMAHLHFGLMLLAAAALSELDPLSLSPIRADLDGTGKLIKSATKFQNADGSTVNLARRHLDLAKKFGASSDPILPIGDPELLFVPTLAKKCCLLSRSRQSVREDSRELIEQFTGTLVAGPNRGVLPWLQVLGPVIAEVAKASETGVWTSPTVSLLNLYRDFDCLYVRAVKIASEDAVV